MSQAQSADVTRSPGGSEKAPAPKPRITIVWNEWWVTLAAFVLAFVIGALLLVFSDPEILAKYGYFFSRPGDALAASWDKIALAYGALFRGSAGSFTALAETSAQAAPLICAGLGVAVAFRSGLFNIGAQGQAIWGAALAAFVGFSVTGLPLIAHLPLAMLAGIVGGVIWGGIVGLLRARTGANEVIITIMLNYVASLTLAWLLTTTAFRAPGRADPISPPVAWTATFPRLEGSRLHLGFFLALVAALFVWWFMERTRVGFELRAVGANPRAAATAGVDVPRVTVVAMLMSGGLAGLAGVQAALTPDVTGLPTPLSAGLVGNVGFDAITVALLGRNRPGGVVVAGLLFGALKAGGVAMQVAQVPGDLTTILQALIVLFIAAPMLVRTLVPFLKEKRRASVHVKGAVA